MIVECPRCSARYRVEDEVLRDEPTFKCSRCSHIFAYDGAPPPRPAPRPVPRSAAGSSESLSFAFATNAAASHAVEEEPSFPDRDEEPEDGPEEDIPDPRAATPARDEDREGDDEDDDEDTRGHHTIDDEEESFAFEDDRAEAGDEVAGEEEEEDEEPGYDEPRHEDEPRFVRGEDELRVEPEADERAPGRPWLVFVALVAILWANVALYLRNHPAEATTLLSHVPVAGPWLTEDRLLQMRLHLHDVTGTWQKIKDDRAVFIVSGRALNTSPRPLKGVQIESTLLGNGGKVLDTKAIFCGNAMSMKIVGDLSSKEISLLQRLEPPQRFEIGPGEAAAFTVVFMDPPNGMREFTARVVGAQRVT